MNEFEFNFATQFCWKR